MEPATMHPKIRGAKTDEGKATLAARHVGLGARRFTAIQAQDRRLHAFLCPNSSAPAGLNGGENQGMCRYFREWRDPDSNRDTTIFSPETKPL